MVDGDGPVVGFLPRFWEFAVPGIKSQVVEPPVWNLTSVVWGNKRTMAFSNPSPEPLVPMWQSCGDAVFYCLSTAHLLPS